MTRNRSFFLDTIFQLRNEEKIVIFSDIHKISQEEEKQVVEFLESNFRNEVLEFPQNNFLFDPEAALWAAKIVYHSAQLYLVRSNTQQKLKDYISDFKEKKTVNSYISADLCLRFLPYIMLQLKTIDINDPLLPLLENILHAFHYSAIGTNIEMKDMNFETHFNDSAYQQLYLERIVDRKDIKRAHIPYFREKLNLYFGIHKNHFWKEL